MTQSNEGIGIALAKIPSGVSIATATNGGQSTGLLASWIQQVSFTPPMVCLAVKTGRPIEALIDGAGRFVINVIGEGDATVMKHFSKGFALQENAFEGLEIENREAGPVLKDCIAHLACKVVAKHEAGDHQLYLGEATAGTGDPAGKPWTRVRESGFSY